MTVEIIWNSPSKNEIVPKNKTKGAANIAVGSFVGYESISHGLPRALGIRIEYHTTSKKNAELIRKAGNILDPKFGGKTGLSARSGLSKYIENSKNYVHITGIHKDSKWAALIDMPISDLSRWFQGIRYNPMGKLLNRVVSFCVPGIDSYFNSNFVPDAYSNVAMKTNLPIKAYNNRFGAMAAGLKKFGLRGMKENKFRVVQGLCILTSGLYITLKMIKKGFDEF